MKKIMFNDKFLLTKAVLDGTKTITRRIVDVPTECVFKTLTDCHGNKVHAVGYDEKPVFRWETRYQIGEVVAIAQPYKTLYPNADFEMEDSYHFLTESKGWNNKMFVKADLMPHHIKITDVSVERLQDITEDDCIKEGVMDIIPADDECMCEGYGYCTSDGGYFLFGTPRDAYAELINKICGKDTWQRNPWMEVYTFERVD